MSIFDEIQEGIQLRPPRIILYGTEGIGKSSFCALSKTKKTLYLNIEDGLDLIDAAKIKVSSYQDYTKKIDLLLKEEKLPYDCICIDTLDALERLVQKYVASKHDKPTVMDIPFGKGVAECASIIGSELLKLDKFRNKGLIVVLTAHSQIKRYESPMTDAFDRYTLKMHDKACAIAKEWCDALLFVTYKVVTKSNTEAFGKEVRKGIGKGDRIVYTEERPAYDAKNRYGLASSVDFNFDNILTKIRGN